MKAIHRYKVLKVGSQELFREKCMYLVSHCISSCHPTLSRGTLLGPPLASPPRPMAPPHSKAPCFPLLQCNHRSWADFMVDQYVTEGRSLFLSRYVTCTRGPCLGVATLLMHRC